jgi:glycosyltransferase involved in cell wall biosynthesis
LQVGLVIYGNIDTISGGYLYDRKLAEYLQDQGDGVQIVSMPWQDYAHHLLHNFGQSFFQQLADMPVDILLQDELNHPSLFLLNRRLKIAYHQQGTENSLNKRRTTPIISIVHHLRSSEEHPTWLKWAYQWIERQYLTSVDGFIYNSRTTQQVVERMVGSVRPAVIAYPGGDQLMPRITNKEIEQRARQPGNLKVLYVGNIIPRKGLHCLIKAMSQLPEEVWELTVVGKLEVDRSYVQRIRNELTARAITDRVHLLGPVSQETLRRQMYLHHVLAVPSVYEGYGIVYLEGMGFGLPAIASTGGAAREIITHGVDGYLVLPGDAHSLAKVVLEMAHNRDRLLDMSLAARRRYLNSTTWEETGRKTRDFLTRILEM